ncbi:MAG: methyltransferase domain-containing protein [bacterium]|nr:methyltransferase domain-containing protein [bacterium]
MKNISTDTLENSSMLWDSLWTNKFTNFHRRFTVSQPVENFVRHQLYFKAINKLLDGSCVGKNILELGCGTGSNSLYLASTQQVNSVTLLDFSPEAMTNVKTETYPCHVKKISKDLLKFSPTKRYDFVHSTGLIEHFSGKERLYAIKKHSQCARSGGLVMIWVPIFSPTFNCIGTFNRWIGIKELPFTKTEMRLLCAQSKLEIINEGETAFGALYGILCRKIG